MLQQLQVGVRLWHYNSCYALELPRIWQFTVALLGIMLHFLSKQSYN